MKIDNSINCDLSGADVFQHCHLPAAAAYCRSLGLVEIINKLVPSQMELSPGLAVQAMVLDTLSGRSPLYRLEEFMKDQDVELLLGEDVEPHLFNDTNVGRSLDAIFKVGTSKILTELGIKATEKFKLDTRAPSYDTTSTNVWGNYYACEGETPPEGPVITYGYSKDHRPDLKQFMTELLCVERGIPIFGKTLDGNSSDKTSNNKMLSRISSLMAKHGVGPGAFVYVADSAMITEENLEAIGANLFISRLPTTYKECGKAIGEAVDADNWTEIGVLAETKATKSRPSAKYKSFETSVTLYGIKYRAFVIHSSAHDKRRQNKLDRDLKKSEKELKSKLKAQSSHYFCEADAIKAATALEKISTKLHYLKVSVTAVEVRKKGRPPKDTPAPVQTQYKLSWDIAVNNDEVETLKKVAGCFVLICNTPDDGKMAMDATAALRTYKGQYGVESDFAFLKDPLIVNDIFLKNPSRIDALGMVLIISLMVWRLMERSMRAYVKNTGKTLPGWNRQKTKLPTTFMMSTMMNGIMVALTVEGDRYFLRRPQSKQVAFLEALGLDADVFTNKTCQCKLIIPKKIEPKW